MILYIDGRVSAVEVTVQWKWKCVMEECNESGMYNGRVQWKCGTNEIEVVDPSGLLYNILWVQFLAQCLIVYCLASSTISNLAHT